MIESIIYGVLKADTPLQNILGATQSDSKIYPDNANPGNLPCIVYYADQPTNPNNEPWGYRQNITFEFWAKTKTESLAIRNRLYTIFNKFDRFFNSSAMAQGIIIRECHAVPAQLTNNFQLETEQAINAVVSFDFQFTKCAQAQGE